MRQLHEKFADRQDVVFIVLVQREPHAGRMGFRDISQPSTLAERTELARRLKQDFSLNLTVLVDPMHDVSRKLYSQLPGPLFIISPEQKIVAKYPWMDESLVSQFLANDTIQK
ncbi:MAG: hypothetical protein ABL888_12855 [Pirellulaceae bacterium]